MNATNKYNIEYSINAIEKAWNELGRFGASTAFLSLLNDFSFCIQQIQEKTEGEDPAKKLAELRDEFGNGWLGDHIYHASVLSDFDSHIPDIKAALEGVLK